jgi:hypothetical protein
MIQTRMTIKWVQVISWAHQIPQSEKPPTNQRHQLKQHNIPKLHYVVLDPDWNMELEYGIFHWKMVILTPTPTVVY